ncbi:MULTISPECIES: hypothetical protein [Sphingomonas]|uniref:Heme/copper-type cytochrome/quinol oxidase subunit 2 n=1 Tax=Sphingomonas kyeonggiensis TaxID=1268553 RepID=A0A7W6JZE1_9SPHN|nr:MULTISPECIES: hypothetical protein [Sphingomonas]MBB4101300.1 heme/copper-type cytochrome/quinol oxidase subunit 2 [Sphingomonas kyeonggiensis]MDQ0249485.1 heme/copper-type cytochrome/quinol oxidase subunit 2 [Sphingomonas kyeonggiensis]WHU02349.1 hypothetical protein O3305_19535 [Sphingomonas sp. NIBR02145]
MEPRLIAAYSLMLVITLLVAGFIAYRIYHGRARSYHRRLRKEARIHAGRHRGEPHP